MNLFWQGVLVTGGMVAIMALILLAHGWYTVMFMDTSPKEMWQGWREDRALRRRERSARPDRPEKIGGYISPKTPLAKMPKVPAGPAPGAQRPEPEEFVKAAMAVDPENLPSWKVYQPREGSPTRACVCHPNCPLTYGQRVLWWPVPKSGGGVNLFCEDGVEVTE